MHQGLLNIDPSLQPHLLYLKTNKGAEDMMNKINIMEAEFQEKLHSGKLHMFVIISCWTFRLKQDVNFQDTFGNSDS